MIARVAVSPLEAHRVPRSEHEGAALLDRIALPHALTEAACEGADALDHSERVKGLGPAMGEPGFPERAERGVDEERAVIPGRRTEAGDVLGPRRAQDDQRAAPLGDRRLHRLEPSDLLAAEDSAEVADERDDRGTMLPGGPEHRGAAVLVEHGEGSEPCGERFAHARYCS